MPTPKRTFSQWTDTAGAIVQRYGKADCLTPQTTAHIVFEREVAPELWRELWHLSDTVVSSLVSGPAVIVIPRNR